MKLALRGAVALSLLAFALACGDDDEGDPNGGNEGGGGADKQCEGVYAAWTQSELEAAVTSGACQGGAEAVCARDLNTEAGICGQTCFGMNMDDPQALATCSLSCLKQGASSNPSDPCLGCYLASVECVRVNCLEPCLANPAGEPCITCRAEEGCTESFYACSGLPEPSPPP